MKTFIFLSLLFLTAYTLPIISSAGELIDQDGDGFYCVQEDDGIYCGEDDQDKCDLIPNVSLNDDNCSVDTTGPYGVPDGKFDLYDLAIISNVHPFYGYWGEGCQTRYKIDEFNRRLSVVGLPLLQSKAVPVIGNIYMPVHCSKAHHTFVEIP